MKLQEALRINRELETSAGARFSVVLALGATPLHLQTLLAAHLGRWLQTQAVLCKCGPYGDLIAAIEAAQGTDADGIAVLVEWGDLDPRLGLRRLGGWTARMLEDALAESERRLERIEALLAGFRTTRIALALPTLPLPPIFQTPRWHSNATELRLRRLIDSFAVAVAELPNAAVVSPAHLERTSPTAERRDVRGELFADFPYTTTHASALAEALARTLYPRPPLKGLITDLDDTLWRGLVGEIGTGNISWTLDDHSHAHALYQQFLHSLGETGTLLAVASKNEPELVAEALARADLLIDKDLLFPTETGWHAKSASVARILEAWNVGADAVAFVDDSPMEVAEVQARFPEMPCFLFPVGRDDEVLELIGELRDLFGKETVTAEDRLRLSSLKSGAELRAAGRDAGSPEEFLAGLQAEIHASFAKQPFDKRPLELINKTNQFNLNGERVTEGEWRRSLERPEGFLLSVSYTDKFGPLGKIAVVSGRLEADEVVVERWVLSCRAFSRRVEYATLQLLFDRFAAARLRLAVSSTGRNAPVSDFLASLGVDASGGPVSITRSGFGARCLPLYHKVLVDD